MPAETVQWGTWEGKPLAWCVLRRDGNRVLLLTQQAIDSRAVNSSPAKGNDWDACDLRKWLVGEFLEEVFLPSERQQLVGEPFLLSAEEAATLFIGDAARICFPAELALEKHIWVDEQGACYWWLRTPGGHRINSANVSCLGEIHGFGNRVSRPYFGVRPAVWVNAAALA